MHRLNAAGEEKQAQALFDVFFKNIDKNLREMGIGDLGVPKHMKRMMQGFNGRANEYEKAVAENDHASLQQAVIRNIYGTVENPDPEVVALMALYIQENVVIDSLGAVFASPLAEPKQAEGRKYG
jgi:cytochrome b pre-mRNA-processing protein 3